MGDPLYVRGWDDCIEAVSMMIAQTSNIDDVKKKIGELHSLVREKKFEKIRHEFGAFHLF